MDQQYSDHSPRARWAWSWTPARWKFGNGNAATRSVLAYGSGSEALLRMQTRGISTVSGTGTVWTIDNGVRHVRQDAGREHDGSRVAGPASSTSTTIQERRFGHGSQPLWNRAECCRGPRWPMPTMAT
jgi:hypothetical protein